MSLDNLLKDPETTSGWKEQRKKLLRIFAGVLLMAIALTVGVFLLFSLKDSAKKSDGRIADAKVQMDADALAQMMKVRQEAEELQKEITELKERSVASDGGQGVRFRTGAPRSGVSTRGQTRGEPIINFDPGDGFVAVDAVDNEIYIPTGSVFQARLITPIKTSVERTFVMAETINEFRMDMKRRIPKGCRLIGRSRLNPVLKGVIVEFDLLVLPNGIETPLRGLALSRNALPEIDGLYFSDRLQTYGTALAFGFLSGFADAARVREPTFFGPQPEVSVSNQMLAGLSGASFRVAEEILRDIRERAIEYVVVPAGEPVFVALTGRYVVEQGGRNADPQTAR